MSMTAAFAHLNHRSSVTAREAFLLIWGHAYQPGSGPLSDSEVTALSLFSARTSNVTQSLWCQGRKLMRRHTVVKNLCSFSSHSYLPERSHGSGQWKVSWEVQEVTCMPSEHHLPLDELAIKLRCKPPGERLHRLEWVAQSFNFKTGSFFRLAVFILK